MTFQTITRPRQTRSVLSLATVLLVAAIFLWPAETAVARRAHPLVLTNVSALPSAIYGGGTATLTYHLCREATVSVVVHDAGGAIVRTLQPDTRQMGGMYALDWDGTDGAGATLAAGSYSLVVRATTSQGGDVRSTQTVQLLASPLTDVSLSPTSFYGGAGSSGFTTLAYTLNEAADVSVIVRDATDTAVRTLRPDAAQAAGTYTLGWNGTDGDGKTLAAGTYSVVVTAITADGTARTTRDVQYSPTPVATEASLALDGAGDYVLRAVIEEWSESLNGQTSANYYFDGRAQPWEFAARSGATLTLYVGADDADPLDTTHGGTASATSDTQGVADLAFPSGLDWHDAMDAPLPLHYSLSVTYGDSTRWYPASGRYALRAPVGADGHLQFAYMSDIQTPLPGVPSPDVEPSGLTAADGPYTAIPHLSRSLGWAAVLAGLRQESAANLVLYGGDPIERGEDATAPDDGATQWRTLLDNEQSFGPSDEWSLSSLAAQVPVASAPGNHDDIGDTDSTAGLWNRWVYSPTELPYYSFDQGDVHFVLLNAYAGSSTAATNYQGWIGFQSDTAGGSRAVTVSDTTYTYTNSAQADWLISAIDTDKPWTVVVMHYPMFDAYRTPANAYNNANTTGGPTPDNKYFYGERDRLLTFFAAHGVDLVLHGHNHNYRRHVEKVRSADGSVASAMTFITQAVAGGPPTARDSSGWLPFLDWVDLNGNGTPDDGEPLADAGNSDYWDASAFGKENNPVGASGYTGTPDMFHAVGEYNDGVSFSYSTFQTGSDGEGVPTLTMNVKFISWDSDAHAWTPWTVYDSAQISQVDDGMVAKRLAGD